MPDYPTFDLGSPLLQLSPTALNILKAARRLLARRGIGALSLENIAAEAGETKSLIRYHFGSKAGLIEVLVDSVVHDANLRLREQVAKMQEGERRAHELIEAQRAMSADKRAFQVFFEILPHALRQKSLRKRGADLYGWYRETDAWALRAADEALTDDELDDLAALTLAVCDGLAIQLLLQPDTFRHERAYRLWEEVVTSFLRARASAGCDVYDT
jgi:AcrR family transcriptional regulator